MRIEQEALYEQPGVMDVENQDGWEYYGYDKKNTRMNLTRIRLFVQEFEPSDDFYDRYKRKELQKEDVPDILDYEL